MIHSFLRCAVGTGGINDIFSTTAVPWDQRSVRFREHRNLLTIDDQNIAPPPANKTGFENKYIKGIGKAGDRVQLLLDCERLLKNDELELIESIK